MSKIGRTLALLGVCLAVLGAAHANEGVVKYRQSVMKALGGHAGATGQILRGNASRDHLAGHAQSIRDLAHMVAAAFEQRVAGEDSRAKPAIWDNAAGFRDAAAKLQQSADALLSAVRSGGDVGERMKALGGSCKGCHDDFRADEK